MATATNKAFIDYYKVCCLARSHDIDHQLTILGAGCSGRRRVGRVHGFTQDRASLDFPCNGFQSVSPASKSAIDVRDAETINDIIKSTYVPEMQNVELEGQRIEPPTQLPW